MIPRFKFIADGKDISADIKKRLISLSVKDEAGIESDSFSFQLFDSPPIKAPSVGTIIEVAMGYGENLIDLGSYATRPVSFKGPPAIAEIEGGVIDRFPNLKEPRKKSWKPSPLDEVIRSIADRHGFISSIDQSCKAIQLAHEDQTESDGSFLTRMAEDFDFIFKIQKNHLIFQGRDSASTPSGQKIEVISLKNILDYDYKSSSEEVYTGVKAFYWDRTAPKEKFVLAGKEGKVYAIKFKSKDEPSARLQAEAKLRKLSRQVSKLNISIPGNPYLFAGGFARIDNFHPEINGIWFITKVEHSLDGSGFITKVSLEGRFVS